MKSDIIVIGGGASGLMAAYAAAKTLVAGGSDAQVTVLEKMPRPGRKIMITGKGRCNFTNLKDWNEFSGHVRSKSSFVKSAFYGFTPGDAVDFFESFGMKTVVERGDRAFPQSYHASDVVDTLVSACHSLGVKIETDAEVESVAPGFEIKLADGRTFRCGRLIVATGGLSYPATGSTGDGYRWAEQTGHRIETTFPCLTALVPKGYKIQEGKDLHICRETPPAELGKSLCGIQLKNVQLSLLVDGRETDTEFGDVDFTDGGIEGPLGFQLSRKAVKSMVNGSKVALSLDLKPGVGHGELSGRIASLWKEILSDPRSGHIKDKEKMRVLLGKLMPWELIPAFGESFPHLRVKFDADKLALALKEWRFDLAGYVGYERAVVTAGGVSTEDVLPKTMESRKMPGMFFCGEVLDVDCDTGGYNLQAAFSTGTLAGVSAAYSLLRS